MYAQYASHAANVHQTGNISIPARGLAANVVEDNTQKAMLSQTQNPQNIHVALDYGAKKTHKEANEFAEANLEGILNGFGKPDLMLAIKATKPRDEYTGRKPATYNAIANLQRRVGEMESTYEKKDVKKMTKIATDFYEDRFSAPEDEDALALTRAFLKISDELAVLKFQDLYKELGVEFMQKLDGNEAGYLAATLEGKDFVQFYGGFLEMKKRFEEASERE